MHSRKFLVMTLPINSSNLTLTTPTTYWCIQTHTTSICALQDTYITPPHHPHHAPLTLRTTWIHMPTHNHYPTLVSLCIGMAQQSTSSLPHLQLLVVNTVMHICTNHTNCDTKKIHEQSKKKHHLAHQIALSPLQPLSTTRGQHMFPPPLHVHQPRHQQYSNNQTQQRGLACT